MGTSTLIGWIKKSKKKLKTIMSKYNFQQMVKTPTRITRNSILNQSHFYSPRGVDIKNI